ncbi:MAG: ribonuclease R family protein [Solirubrobacteraceae bacterium]
MSAVETLVGVLERRGRFFVAEPLFGPGRGERPRGQVTVNPGGGRAGELVLLAVEGRRGRARVIRRLGQPDVARDVLEGLMLERGLRRRFDPVVEQIAAEATGEGERDGRRDLRGLSTFTVDPASARDFDDAISAERIEGGCVRVWVHIADVSSFVREGSPVDREARRRATSVYVPGAVEPMLPTALSNESCSLVPGAERLAVSVEMEFDGPRVRSASFARTLIRSDKRLDYERVDRIFAGAETPGEGWGAALEAAREVSRALGDARAARGALEIVSGEPDFGFDAAGHVVSIEQGVQSESHRLIEHLMIAANEQVAKLLAERSQPTLYRVHEQPDPERVERLVEQLASLGVPTPPIPERLSGTQAAELLGALSVAVDRHVKRDGRGRLALTSLVLRSLKQAYYSPRNIGHAGLRSPRYCHFTSPIRRYPDLVCHRALLHAIGAGERAPAAFEMSDLGEWCSLREREAMAVERAADDIARAFALMREPGERTWAGEITGLIGAGAFVAFGPGFEGMLPARRLRSGWWELNETGTILQNVRGAGAMRLGDLLDVRVRGIDAPRGRVDLDLA